MRIVIDGRMMSWTGIGRYTRALLEHLQELDQENEYVVLMLATDLDRWEPTGKNFRKQVANFRPYSLGEQVGLAVLLYRLRPDLVHFLSFNAPVLYLRKRIYTIHDTTLIHFKNARPGLLPGLKYQIKYFAMRFAMRHAVLSGTGVITPSQFVKADLMHQWKAINGEKVAVTYEAADPPASVTPEPLKDVHGRFLLFSGNAYPYKNVGGLIKAFKLLKDPDLKLVITGGKDGQFYENLKHSTHDPRIHFPGFVSEGQLAWLYQHAEAFVFPSLSEGFGLPGLEAMARGTAVISAEASCLPEIYGDAAVYFDPLKPANMADVIMRTLGTQAELGRLRQAGPRRVAEFSWRRMAEQTLAVYLKS